MPHALSDGIVADATRMRGDLESWVSRIDIFLFIFGVLIGLLPMGQIAAATEANYSGEDTEAGAVGTGSITSVISLILGSG